MSSDDLAVNQSVSEGPLECYDISVLTICDKFVEIEDTARKSQCVTELYIIFIAGGGIKLHVG